VPEEEKIPVRVVVGAANNGGSSAEAKAARVAEPTGTQPTNNQNDIPSAKARVNRADIRLMLRRLVMNDFYAIVSLTPTNDSSTAIIRRKKRRNPYRCGNLGTSLALLYRERG
jgi:hypothetical protein